MTVTPATSTTSSTGATNQPDAMKALSSNFSTFLTLLTTQLKNQDPTSPMDSNQFTQQLVMYSQVEQQINTNGNASLTNGSATWTYNLKSAAATTQLSISNANGKTVYTGTGQTAAGNGTFTWNGKDNNGNQLPDGTYKLTVTAADSAGNNVTSSVASAGIVTQIDMTGTTPKLIVGNLEVSLGDIAAVAN
jgi:flagellar basal-body rod modification protein FlgD